MAQTVYTSTRTVQTEQNQIIPPQVVQNKIDLRTANDAPWALLTRAAKKMKPVGDNQFDVYYDLLVKGHTTLAADTASGATSWVLATGTGKYAANWDILWNRTRNLYVHAVTLSTDTWTVVDNIDSGTASAGVAGDEIIILGNATEEAGGIPLALSTQETKYTNYIQDVMTPFEMSDLAMNADSFFEEKDWDYQKSKAAVTHQRKLERIMKFAGKAAQFTPSTSLVNPVDLATSTSSTSITQGFKTFMSSNADSDHYVTDTDLTENEFIDRLTAFFFGDYEGQNKKQGVIFAPPNLLAGMMKWNIGRNQFTDQTSGKEATLGLKFMSWATPFGPMKLIVDFEMQSSVSGASSFYAMVDLAHIGYVPYRNLDTHVILDAVKDGRKRKVGYYRTVFGTWYTLPNSHLWGAFTTTS